MRDVEVTDRHGIRACPHAKIEPLVGCKSSFAVIDEQVKVVVRCVHDDDVGLAVGENAGRAAKVTDRHGRGACTYREGAAEVLETAVPVGIACQHGYVIARFVCHDEVENPIAVEVPESQAARLGNGRRARRVAGVEDGRAETKQRAILQAFQLGLELPLR